MSTSNIPAGYAADAESLIPRFEALRTSEVLAPVMDMLPTAPCRVLEVGAGTGRDAAWLAGQGHEVVAVEPVEAFRSAGVALHPARSIRWLDDRLPLLKQVAAMGETFDLVLLVAVWQHVQSHDHPTALAVLADLIAPGGQLIMSVRHGPGSPARPCFPADVDQIIRWAQAAGLRLTMRRQAQSVQRKNRDAGVTWTWLCMQRD